MRETVTPEERLLGRVRFHVPTLAEEAVTAVDVERGQVWSGPVGHKLTAGGVTVVRFDDDGVRFISEYVAGRVTGMEIMRA
jgi:hypothetical protein